ncbi:MAG: HNH endonuclease [Proteobacteria bacterium]|jgi:hypothetical protein|nr:HNH endonuclease [Pseudomonadota bacterium]
MYKEFTRDQVDASVIYDPVNGRFYRVKPWNGEKPGTECGFVSNGDGYVRVSISGSPVLAHRAAWFICAGRWPTTQIDHVNGDRSDNRIENLRVCTISENRWNSKKRVRNTSGFKGVSWDVNRKMWIAQIMANRKNYMLGRFKTPEEAHLAYIVAANRLHGEFARTE